MELISLFYLAITLIAGLLLGRAAKLVKMPNVTGYLIAGLLLGPSVLKIIPADAVQGFNVISEVALGFIAFSIGSEFKLSMFKKVGITPIVIAITESLGAVIFVIAACLLLRFDTGLSILLGAIAAATAPAQTIMVIQQYKAKGTLTSTLLSVVALDDAVALIAFGFAAATVKAMNAHQAINILSILAPFKEILLSLILGGAVAGVMSLFLRFFKKPSNVLCIICGFILLAVWSAHRLDISPLLTCMTLGGVLANIVKDMDGIVKVSEAFTPPVYMLFFAMSGAGFDLKAIAGIGVIGITYVVMRVLGKMAGAWFGGVIMKAEKKVCRYLGPTLMPQAGVALGLILVAESIVPEFAQQIRTVILCSTFIYSIVGPSVAKAALVKAGEITLEPKPAKAKV